MTSPLDEYCQTKTKDTTSYCQNNNGYKMCHGSTTFPCAWSCSNNTCKADPQGTFGDDSCNGQCTSPTPQTKYTCSANGCIIDPNGDFCKLSACQKYCPNTPVPVPALYNCVNGTCALSANGTTLTNCQASCPPPPPPPPTAKYDCVNNACVTSATGPYSSSDCSGQCPKYGCVNNACAPVADGQYSSSDCSGKCTAPPPPPPPPASKYDCVNNACVTSATGPYASSDCGGKCPRYDCANNACVLTTDGPYSSSDCGGTCTNPVAYWSDYCKTFASDNGCYTQDKGTWCESGACFGCPGSTCGKWKCNGDECVITSKDDPEGKFWSDTTRCAQCGNVPPPSLTPLPSLQVTTPFPSPLPPIANFPPPLASTVYSTMKYPPAPNPSKRSFRMTLWHEGVNQSIQDDPDKCKLYFANMMRFVADKQFDRVFMQAMDPTMMKYGKPLFAYAQSQFIVDNYLSKLPAYTVAGLLIVVNPQYVWTFQPSTPGGIKYNNPGYTNSIPATPDGSKYTQPYRYCTLDNDGQDTCFDQTTSKTHETSTLVANISASTTSFAITPWLIPGTCGEPANPTLCTSPTPPFILQMGDERMLVNTVDSATNMLSVKRGIRGTVAATHGAGDSVQHILTACIHDQYMCDESSGKSCCLQFNTASPNNLEQAMLYVNEINELAKSQNIQKRITTIAFDGEDLGAYGADNYGMAQAWQAARTHAPDVIELGAAHGPSINTTATMTNAAYPELYWIGELKVADVAKQCYGCNHAPDIADPNNTTCENCKDKIYQQYLNDPQCMLKAFKIYLGDKEPMVPDPPCADPKYTFTTDPNAHLPDMKNHPGTCPLVSIEHAHYSPKSENVQESTCVQKTPTPSDTDSGGICGTFDGFGNWEWTQFEAFLTMLAERYSLTDIGVYEYQFVPPSWMPGNKFLTMDDMKSNAKKVNMWVPVGITLGVLVLIAIIVVLYIKLRPRAQSQ